MTTHTLDLTRRTLATLCGATPPFHAVTINTLVDCPACHILDTVARIVDRTEHPSNPKGGGL